MKNERGKKCKNSLRLEFFFSTVLHKNKTMPQRFSLFLLALLVLLALGDASAATSASASSTAVSTLPPAGEVVELTVREKIEKRRIEDLPSVGSIVFVDGRNSQPPLFLSLARKKNQDDNFDGLTRADTHTDWLVAVVVRSFFFARLLFCFSAFPSSQNFKASQKLKKKKRLRGAPTASSSSPLGRL